MRPFVFNEVEVRGVSGQVFELVPGFADDILDILSLVKSGVVHHDNANRRKFGNRSCTVQARKTSALMFVWNNPMVCRNPPVSAPMTLVRPLACQSRIPWHLCPMGAYPYVRGIS